jgi:PAS domain S-box-containing protein
MDELPGGLVFLDERRPEPVRRAVLLPIICAGEVIGFAITGVNPRQPFDEDYREFLEHLASYIACAIASARAFEEQRRRADTLADTEAQHRASEEHLRLALEVGPVGTWEWDPGRETVTADAAHQSLFGLTPQPGPRPLELYRDRMSPDDFAVGVERATAALQRSSIVRHEHRVRLPDGQTRWLLSLGRAKRGDPACMIGISLDMTERRRMEEELRRSELRLRAAADLLGLGLYDWDPRTDALQWDARVKAMWGLPPDAHVDYEVWRSHVHPGDLERVLTAINGSVDARGDGLYDIDYRVIGADGVERWIRTRGHTTFGKDGPEAITGVALDITERKKAEQRLLEDEARLSAILAQLPIGVGLVDPEGRFLLRGGLLAHLWDDAMASADPRQRDRWQSFDADGHMLASESYPAARALCGETVVPGLDFTHTSDTGHETWIRVAAVPFRDMNGEIKGAVSILDDIDREKRAEQDIRDSEQRFREFSKHSTQVIWILSAREGRLEYLSPAYEHIWGQPRELGQGHWAETIHPEDQDAAVAALDRVVLGETVVREYRVIRPDGGMRSVRDTLFPMRNRHGRIERIGGISQDITVHTQSCVYLVDSEERSRADVQRVLMKAGYRVKSFATGSEFLAVAPVLAPGCVILDIRSPQAGGLAVARQLKATGSQLPVLVAGASQGDIRVAIQAMKTGAVDWIEMPCAEAVLLEAVASALADVRAVAERNWQVTRVRSQITSMTDRERQVLEGLLAGGTNKTIGRDLGISPRTVELYRASVMEKLGVQSLTQAVLLTAAAGILPINAASEHGLVRKRP